MKIYAVGGAVRDELLGLPVADRDYVVVGATPEDMVARGFLPVGKDFPVFLHPVTHEEYALARTERKSGRGYRGFTVYASPEVTLEEDLARRDLTINAIAKDEAGHYIDPYGGMRDLKARLLRHVSPAFSEDPVRILRVARFAARFTDFEVAEETLALMKKMVDEGEVDALVPERVWQELARGLMEARPTRMFEVLRACGALSRILPEVDRLFGVPQNPLHHPEVDTGVHVMRVIDVAAREGWALPVRFAGLCHDLGKGLTPKEQWPAHPGHEERGVGIVKELCARLAVPHACRDLALLVTRWHGAVYDALAKDAAWLTEFLVRLDAFRQPERFAQFLLACEADFRGRPGFEEAVMPHTRRLRLAFRAAKEVDAGAVARQHRDGEAIRRAVFEARREAVHAALLAAEDPQDQGEQKRHQEAGGDGEVEGEALALDADVAGKLPEPQFGDERPGQSQENEQGAQGDEPFGHGNNSGTAAARWEHFSHGADIGVRGIGPEPARAFEQAACALTAVVCDPRRVEAREAVTVEVEAPDLELLLVDWLNAIIFEMATRHMLFGRYQVTITGTRLLGRLFGEAVDVARHEPAVEVKGATYTELAVFRNEAGEWVAQCVVDV